MPNEELFHKPLPPLEGSFTIEFYGRNTTTHKVQLVVKGKFNNIKKIEMTVRGTKTETGILAWILRDSEGRVLSVWESRFPEKPTQTYRSRLCGGQGSTAHLGKHLLEFFPEQPNL